MNPVSSVLAHALNGLSMRLFWSLEIKNGGVVIGPYNILAALDKILKGLSWAGTLCSILCSANW